MPLETINIPLSREPVYEASAAFMAPLAYPEPDDINERGRFHCAFCRQAILGMAKENDDFAWGLQAIRPVYFLMDDRESLKVYKRGFGRFADRQVAANSTWPLFEEVLKDSPIKTIRAFGSGYSNTPGHRHFLTDIWRGNQNPTKSTIKNITSQIEAPSRPIIHAAFAFWSVVKTLLEYGIAKDEIEGLRIALFEKVALAEVLTIAERCRELAPTIADLKVSEADLIQFVAT